MMTVGGNTGGGACSRSITDLATSAAERIVLEALGARGFAARRGLSFFGADLGSAFGRLAFGGLAFGGLAFCATGFPAAGLRTDASAASSLRRASFAALFSTLNNLRACLSVALASRTLVFAAAARAVAWVAATLSRFVIGDWVVIYGSTRIKN
jgi:hypothetical protein